MKKNVVLGILLILIIIIGCDDNNDSNKPEPTPTPGYTGFGCYGVICRDASTTWDFCVRDGAYFQNTGNIAGSAYAILYVQQPQGNTIGTWSQEIYLNPGDQVWLEHVFCEPTVGAGTVYCYCDCN